jgi:hypothetical protein
VAPIYSAAPRLGITGLRVVKIQPKVMTDINSESKKVKIVVMLFNLQI